MRGTARKPDAHSKEHKTERSGYLRNQLLSARGALSSMVTAFWLGLLTPKPIAPRGARALNWQRKLGSIDEPLGSPTGVPPWAISALVLLLVAAILVLAVVFLIPPGPPPYT